MDILLFLTPELGWDSYFPILWMGKLRLGGNPGV